MHNKSTESYSDNYILQSGVLDDDEVANPSCGLIINDGRKITNNPAVSLSLICSDKDSCARVAISNSGVGWPSSQEYDYAISSSLIPALAVAGGWNLGTTDGEKHVYVKFKDGTDPGSWSSICSDTIVLDTTAPHTTASPVGGTFMSSQSVTLTSSEAGVIYYTLDGSVPTAASTVYAGPIPISANETDVKFFSVDSAGNPGEVKTEHYRICNGSNFTLTGIVKDATLNNTPIPFAIITLSNGQTTNSNDPAGDYTFSGLAKGFYSIESVKVRSLGYVTYQKQFMFCNQDPPTEDNPIILTKNNTVFGNETNSGYSWGSVNTATGNYVYEVTDLAVPGIGIPFSFERAYNSQDSNNGPLGYGWNHSYNISLTVGAGGDVTIRLGDGKTESWVPDGSGGYTPRAGVFSTLTKTAGMFALKQKNMTTYQFDASNMLTAIVDENGNTVTFTPSGANLGSITDTAGRTIFFSYDTSSPVNHITRILDPTGRSVVFRYDVEGNLVSSSDPATKTTTYSYDANHQLLTITDPRGNPVITNTYDNERWVVVAQRDALGGETLYSYDAANKVTQIVDPYGNVSAHHFDDLLRLTKEVDARGNDAVYAYNARGSIESVVDKNGNTTSYEYDGNGNVTKKTEPLGKVSTARYNADNNPTEKVDPNGNKTLFEYSADGKGNLVKATEPDGRVTTFTYEGRGLVETKTDPSGVVRNYYDVHGNLAQTDDQMNNEHAFVYDSVGRKLAEYHPLNRATAYEYDSMDRLVAVYDALGGETRYTYDANGNKTEHLDARENKVIFAYDKKNRLASKTTPLLETESYTYDLMDRRVGVRNPRGATASVVYDAMGNVIREIDALGNQVQHDYDANGNRTRTIDAMGNVTTFTFDPLNRLVRKTDSFGKFEAYTYDDNGNRLTATDATGRKTVTTFDSMNRVKTIEDPLHNVTTSDYDLLGRLVKVIDARMSATSFEYDALGRMVRVTDAAGGIVEATYDELGNRKTMTGPCPSGAEWAACTAAKVTTYTYDVLNRLTAEVAPHGTTQTVYDVVGNVTMLSDADGTTNYTYDKNNRVTQVVYPDLSSATYTYDANGSRKSVTDGVGTTAFAYDSLDRVSTVTDPYGMTVGYTYDPNGKRTSTKYPGNRPVFYYYDDLNRLIAVEDWGGIATVYDYDDAGRLVGQVMGNGAIVTYTYDDAGRLVSKEDKAADGTVIASHTYELDKVGNRTSMTMDQPLVPVPRSVGISFGHNAANQIVSASGIGLSGINYGYDGKGNRTSRVVDAVNTTWSPDTTQYAYNFQNRLTGITRTRMAGKTTETEIHEYRYSSDGKRLASVANGVETRYLLDLNGGMENVIAEMDATNNVKRYYVYGDGLLYSIDGTTGDRLYYHYDPLGSTVAISDANGAVTDKYAYLPFGELSRSETVHDNPFTYVGKFGVMTGSNGLYFMRARFYDTETRRFVSVDPVKGEIRDTKSINQYLYAGANPMMLIDPIGLYDYNTQFWTGVSQVALGVGSVVGGFAAASASVACTVASAGACAPLGAAGMIAAYAGVIGGGASIIQGLADIYDSQNGENHVVNPLSVLPGMATALITGDEEKTNAVMKYFPLIVGALEGDVVSSIVDISNTLIVPAIKPNSSGTSTPSSSGAPGSTGTSYEKKVQSLITKLTDPSIDKETKSSIEKQIQKEVKKKKTKDRERARRDREEEAARQKALYESAMISLSKYSVLVQDLNRLPTFNSGNRSRQGVYGKR